MSGHPSEAPTRAPDSSPLSGVRVLEVGGYIAAPYASSILCSLGAEVIKVEHPEGGDAFRRGVDHASPYFAQYNAGKKSVAVDLKQADGVELVKLLVRTSDVFIENVRPGKLEALGLGSAACLAENPRLVYTSVTGFGEVGPLVQRPAYDSIGQSLGGLYSILNDPDDARLSGTCLADLITGIIAATGVLAGLVARGHGASGTVVQTSMFEAVSTLTIDALTQLGETGVPPTRESRHPQAQNFCLRTGDGERLTLHLSSSEKFWHQLADLVDKPELKADPRFLAYSDRVENYLELRAVLEPVFSQRDSAEWGRLLTGADIPFAPVLNLADVVGHPQTGALDLMTNGVDQTQLVNVPWRFAGSRPKRETDVPRIGEHSREIAVTVSSEPKVRQLLESGTLFQALENQPTDDIAQRANTLTSSEAL
ncbi:CaiB/BaiF CoA transferase family protein [Rhodococcus jostii]|uniref:Crotonobetainyl-CoA:carnitine CoA-transferase CaiB n=1 Tax=Rhodococcus jostii TaxID=132919 RepID=A0A1H4JNH7_RHOJO|nr:CaiB/BaiF CoA-transferase family protein [Rhodococcus jostii]SEB47436.1 Crotonobetainyl-CoA:carnitine CoA-transferase CaiB [Rhodococcus jostii]